MPCRRDRVVWLGLVACAFWAGPAPAQEAGPPRRPAALPLDEMPPGVREQVRHVTEHPTVAAQGASETFLCSPGLYNWLLDHPDRAVAGWRRLGAQVVDISDRGNGRYGWSDGAGSDVHWDTVYQGERLRVWYASGRIKPGPLLAAIPFQAVVVLRHTAGEDEKGRSVVQHQADLILHTDSRSAVLVARLLGSTTPRLAEQYVGQIEMFFSGLPWYIQQHPDRAEELLSAQPALGPSELPEPRRRLLPFRRTPRPLPAADADG
jgi:hypothetical protein